MTSTLLLVCLTIKYQNLDYENEVDQITNRYSHFFFREDASHRHGENVIPYAIFHFNPA